MTYCEKCEGWFCRTEEALEIRRDNSVEYPSIGFHECPACGGKEWALSDRFVVESGRDVPSGTAIILAVVGSLLFVGAAVIAAAIVFFGKVAQ